MSQHQLSVEDKIVINEFEHKFGAGLRAMELAKQLNVGDYLILFLQRSGSEVWEVDINSYGAPNKYKVVHIDQFNMPYVKQVNARGKPVGRLFTCMAALPSNSFRPERCNFKFELDPDFADSIILQEEYDPATLHKSKSDIWKAVTAHNKAIKVDTRHVRSIIEHVKTLNAGDVVWTSNNGYFTLVNKPPTLGRSSVLEIKSKQGKIKTIELFLLKNKALYKDRPRSYSELKI